METKNKPPSRGPLLTVGEAATAMNVHPKTVRQFIKNRQLAVIKIGRAFRIDPVDLERFVAAHRYT